MKKSDRIARELEQSLSTGVENAKDWAAPRVEAAVNWAVPRLQQGLDTASPKIQEGLKSAAHNLADGVATVTPRLQGGLAQLAPKIHDAVDGATPRLHEALDKAAPVIANARDRVVVDYLPRLSDQIGYASDAVHRTLEGTPARVDAVAQKLGDVGIIHAVQEQARTAGGHLKAAATEAGRTISGEPARPPKPKHRGLLIVGVISAAVAAGVAAWKASRPVEDPWKTPEPVTPAPVTATTVNEAKDAADTAAAAAAEKAEAASQANSPAADLGDPSGTARHAAGTAGDADDLSAAGADAETAVNTTAAGRNTDPDRNAAQ